MKKILQFLWDGCWHNWKHLSTGFKTIASRPSGCYYVYKCSKCDMIEDRNKDW